MMADRCISKEWLLQALEQYKNLKTWNESVCDLDTVSRVLGPARVKAVCQRVQEIVQEFADAWSPCPEQDYQQDRLDRALKDVFGEGLQLFGQRYPYIKEQKYRR